MRLTLAHGDILREHVAAIVVTANPWLNLSGGVGGALLLAGGDDVQRELHAWLKQTGKTWLPAGSIVCTGPGPLAANGCRLLVHAVAIDALYQTDEATVRRTLAAALQAAADRGMQSIALPALATGYGPLSIREFCAAARPILLADWPGLQECRLVVKDADALAEASAALG
ncbi:MAG: macro domain-containing protein [Pirellulales bacterium]